MNGDCICLTERGFIIFLIVMVTLAFWLGVWTRAMWDRARR